MSQGNAIPELTAPPAAGRGRPRLRSRREAAEELEGKLNRHLIEHTVPRAYSLMCRAIDQGHAWIDAGRPPTREHMKAQQDALRLAGIREPDKGAGDRSLVDLSIAQLEVIIREKAEALRDITPKPSAQDIEKLM